MIRFFNILSGSLLSALLVVAGCGGGTVGTGGTGSNEFQGKILATDGSPVSDAVVTIAETGDAAVTDAEGDFTIESKFGDSQATILVETPLSSGETVVKGLPEVPVVVEVSLVLDENKKSLEVSSSKVTPKETPAPTIVPTPAFTPVPLEPTHTPTVAPTPDMGGGVTPEPTPTSTETPLPTATPTSTPSVARSALIRGTIDDTEAFLLNGAKIGIVGNGAKSDVEVNGSFSFRADLDLPLKLVVLADGRRDVALIEGVTADTKRVVLSLSIKEKPNGGIRIVIKSTRIVLRDTPD